MNERPPGQRLTGNCIQCRQANGQLELRLPARALRMATSFGGLFCVFAGLLLLVAYISEGWLPAVLGMGSVAAIILSVAFASMADAYLTTTSVLITKDRVVIKNVLYGRKKTQEYARDPQSRARQWYLPPRPGRRARPQGIEIGPEPYNPEAGSDLRDETRPRFGASLSPGELDWVEWRINQFLAAAAEAGTPATETASPRSALGPLEGIWDHPVSRPQDTKVRIEEDTFETRIYFPNGIERRSFQGIGQAIFGLGWSVFFVWLVLQSPNRRAAEFGFLLMYGLFLLVGLMFVVSGLARLFGRRWLTIGPERITYRVTLWGIGPWQTLKTAAVLSCGLREIKGVRKPEIAPAKRCVIRTANSELNFGEQLRPGEECRWVASEVTRRIHAARAMT